VSGWQGIDRRAHWLSRNKGSKRPEAILFLDTEASIEHLGERHERHTFRLGVGCFCTYSPGGGLQPQEWRDLGDEVELWNWTEELSKEHEDLLVVSHNIDYDSRIARAFFYLPHLGWEPGYLIVAQSCSLYKWERGDHEITLLDNLNLCNAPLSELGQNVGLPKLEVDFETVTDEALAVYCRRDVEILVRWWQRWLAFLDEHDLGNFGITIARQAFNAFKHQFLGTKVGIHNHSTAMALERDAYHGGRVECFRVGKLPPGTYYKVDVNSLYPAMMKWYPMPTKLVGLQENVDLGYLDHLLRDHLVIAEVALDAREPTYVKQVGGRNCYPTGSFFTTLTTPELKLARINDEVKGVGRVAIYEGGNIFSEYVDFFYDLRQQYKAEGNRVYQQICKDLMNKLSGKFGQRGYKQEIVGEAPIDEVWVKPYWDVDTDEPFKVYCFGGKVIEQRMTGESWDSLPAIPAHICAYGRLYMWSLIQKAGTRHVAYTDTDSLLVDEEGFSNLEDVVDQVALGMLKLEGVAQNVEIYAKKDYLFGTLAVSKGIKKNAVEIEPNLYEQFHFSTIKYAFRAGNLDGVDVFKVRKCVRRIPASGAIGKDGWIRPPHLHLNPQELYPYRAERENGHAWTWEFDPGWLERIDALDHLRERATYELNLLPETKGQKQPAPLALEPVGA